MKERNGFVSNSSSSTFVIITHAGIDSCVQYLWRKLNGETLVIPTTLGGCYEFGWGPETIDDVGSRFNFAYLQALHAERDDWLDMLNRTIMSRLEVADIDIQLTVNHEDDEDADDTLIHGYIDHQSNAIEGENIEIFESIENLEGFLFGANTRIEVDNDNH
jgi:hypothetical protein